MAPSKEVAVVGSNALASIDPDQTLKASKALLAHIKKAAKETSKESAKRNLLEDEDDEDTPIWLTLTTKRHIADKARLQPGKIPVPHSLNTDENTTICAITADPQRAYKNIIGSDEFPAELSKRITRVIDFGKLKAKYGQYDAQRKLFSEHDIFLADDRIINRLPKVLGKTFYKTTAKRPIPVVLSAKRPKADGKRAKRDNRTTKDKDDGVNAGTAADIAKEIEKALGSALVSLSPTTNTAVRIGYAHWTPEQIADNVDAVATGLVGKWVPQAWRNVRSIYIKGPATAALPVWLTDELWLDEKDVIADLELEQGSTKAEKPNVGKKRKSLGAGAEPEPAAPAKKAKKADKPAAESNDDKLDKQIAERKAKLRKHKAAAAKAMDD